MPLNCFLYWWPKLPEKDFIPPWLYFCFYKAENCGVESEPLGTVWEILGPKHLTSVLFFPCSDLCWGKGEGFLNDGFVVVVVRLQELEIKSHLNLCLWQVKMDYREYDWKFLYSVPRLCTSDLLLSTSRCVVPSKKAALHQLIGSFLTLLQLHLLARFTRTWFFGYYCRYKNS